MPIVTSSEEVEAIAGTAYSKFINKACLYGKAALPPRMWVALRRSASSTTGTAYSKFINKACLCDEVALPPRMWVVLSAGLRLCRPFA